MEPGIVAGGGITVGTAPARAIGEQRPLVGWTSAADLEREAERRAEAERATQAQSGVLRGLAGHIRSAFQAAEKQKVSAGITDRLLRCRRQKAGEYEADRAQLIAQQGGTQLYFNITETKCEALEGWLSDVVNQTGKRFWSVAPSPLPSLPQAAAESVVTEAVQGANTLLSSGQAVDREQVMQLALDAYDARVARNFREAQARAKRMEEKIADQLVEGGFYTAFNAFIKDLATYPTAFMKGPVMRPIRRLRWGTAGNAPEVTQETVPTYTAVSPFDAYPGPNARTPNDSYFIERIQYDRAELATFRGKEGYSAAAIDAVLSPQAGGDAKLGNEIQGEPERRRLENKDESARSTAVDQPTDALEYWGNVEGRLLLEWDQAWAGIKPEDYYEITAILIGDVVVRAILNPNPLGTRPYYACSYIQNPGSIWGRGIPEKMRDCQDAVNATHRSLINNQALSSGPQVAVDSYLVDAASLATKIIPWKIWTYSTQRNPGASGRSPIEFFQARDNSRAMMEIARFYETAADDRTMIPKYTYGNENVGGAGQTASGLSMLMTSAARGVKRVLANIDRYVTCPLLTMQYQWNMLYLTGDDAEQMKGDCFVVPSGIMAILMKEQVQQARMQFLTLANNPQDNQIIGLAGRATMLQDVITELNWPADIIPDKSELLRRTTEALAAQATANAFDAEAAAGDAGTAAAPSAPPGAGQANGSPRQLPIQPAE